MNDKKSKRYEFCGKLIFKAINICVSFRQLRMSLFSKPLILLFYSFLPFYFTHIII